MSNDGAINAAARGEHRAGQGCPRIGIQLESLFSQLAAIDNQDSLVGDNIIFGSRMPQVRILSLGPPFPEKPPF